MTTEEKIAELETNYKAMSAELESSRLNLLKRKRQYGHQK